MSQLYRKYSLSVTQNGVTRSTILHTQAEMLGALLVYTAEGARVEVRERWLEDQGAGVCEGEPRESPNFMEVQAAALYGVNLDEM